MKSRESFSGVNEADSYAAEGGFLVAAAPTPLVSRQLSLALATACLFAAMTALTYGGVAPVRIGQGAETGAGGEAAAESPAILFRRGVEAMQRGEPAVAEQQFRKVIALDPKSAAAYINLGVALMRQKRWDDALRVLRTAETLAPAEPGVRLNIGLAYYRKNDFAAAIEPFSESLKLAPASIQARHLLGLCYFFTSRYPEASSTLAPLWERESTNLNYLYVLSIAASKAGDSALQKKAFGEMLAVGQDTPEFHLYVGKAWLAEGNLEKALAEFQAAAGGRPTLPLVHYFLGRTYLEQRSLEKAEVEFREDARLEPDFAYNYESLGMLYAQQGHTAEAERCFREATQKNAVLVNSWVGLAKLDREAGRNKQALDSLDQAVALAPQSASVHYARGQVLARLGQATASKEEFAKAATLLKSFNDRLQQDPSGTRAADAQDAAQQ